jgi:ORF6N domain
MTTAKKTDRARPRESPLSGRCRWIREKCVWLDEDLAKLYGVLPMALNQAVKRKIERFPEDFMFQLTKEE